MQIGMIGLGRMGGNMVRRLIRGGHECVVYDLNPNAIAELVADGASGAGTLDEFVQRLQPPRTAWIMVPAGDPTEGMVQELGKRMEKGDAIVDGGNSYYKDDVRRGQELAAKGIYYVDAGTSGGVWGARAGLLPDGRRRARSGAAARSDLEDAGARPWRRAAGRPAVRAKRAPPRTATCTAAPCGAGHFVKMVHNGIEYGLMQAYAEGFDIFRNATSKSLPEEHRYDLDLADIAEVWRRGSVVSSWLLDLTARRSPRIPICRVHRRGSGLRRGALDDHGGDRGGGARATCSRRRCSLASARARSTPSARRCSPPCATSSAATWSVRPRAAGRRTGDDLAVAAESRTRIATEASEWAGRRLPARW